jgi:uncharacterized protein DUF5676
MPLSRSRRPNGPVRLHRLPPKSLPRHHSSSHSPHGAAAASHRLSLSPRPRSFWSKIMATLTADSPASAPRADAPLRLYPLGMSLGLTLAIFFALCVALGALWPDFGLHKPWLQFYPGFEWLTWKGFFIGLAEAFAYGWAAALVFTPLYNLFSARR